MEDINSMSLHDFNCVFEYLDRRRKIDSHQPVPLRDSNKRMIKAYKDNIGEK